MKKSDISDLRLSTVAKPWNALGISAPKAMKRSIFDRFVDLFRFS